MSNHPQDDIEIAMRQAAARSEEAWRHVAAVEHEYPFDPVRHREVKDVAEAEQAIADATTEVLSRMIEEKNR